MFSRVQSGRSLIFSTFAALVLALLVISGSSTDRPVAASLTDGLVGHWTFDDATASDASGNGNDGVVNGALPSPGQVGAGAFDFDGSNDYIDTGNIDVTGSELTLAAWINPDNLANCGASDCRIASKASGLRTPDHYFMLSSIDSSGVKLRFRLRAGGSTETLIASSGNLSNGQWAHVAATYDGASMRLFLDGVEVGAVAKTGVIDTDPSLPFWIGDNPPTVSSRSWDGEIDDVRLYDRALAPGEIQQLASGNLNASPVAFDDAYAVDEDAVLSVAAPGVLDNDTDTEGDPLSAVPISNPTNGILALDPDGSFIYTPNPDFNGTDSFTYQAADATGTSVPATVTITVNAVPDAPVADDQAVSTEQEVPLPLVLTGSDADGDSLTFSIVTPPLNGVISGAPSNVVYTPNSGFAGLDAFSYIANDGILVSAEATVSIDVTPVNSVPVAIDDAYSVDEDAVLTVLAPGVLVNDTDADFDSLTVVQVSVPANGTLAAAGDGSFTYTPDGDFWGIDSFSYKAYDGLAESLVSATVTITVDPVNDAPVADDQSVSTPQDVPLEITLTGSDVDGDGLTFSTAGPPTFGTLSPAPPFTYTPNAGYTGPDSFTFTSTDGLLPSNVATVSIAVTQPDPGLIGYWSFDAGTGTDDSGNGNDGVIVGAIPDPGIDGSGGLLFDGTNDYVDLGTLDVTDGGAQLQAVSLAAWVRSDLLTNCSARDCRIFSKATGLSTQDHYLMLSTIRSSASTRLRFRLKTNGDTDTLIANTGTLQNGEWAHVAAVYDGTQMQVYVDGAPVGSMAKSGTIDINPLVATWIGGNPPDPTSKPWPGAIDEVRLYNRGLSGTEVEALATVVPIDAPVAFDDAFVVDEDAVLSVLTPGVLANDTSTAGGVMTSDIASGPTNGALALAADGSFIYTPDGDFWGIDSFTYRAADAAGPSLPASVTITVNAVPDAPVADDQLVSAREHMPQPITLTGSDADGDSLTFSIVTPPSNGSLLGTPPNLVYTPDPGHTGLDSFTFEASDGPLSSNVATVTIDVTPSNGLVRFFYGANQQFNSVGRPQVWVDILGNASDPEGVASLTFSLNGGSEQTLSIGPDDRRLDEPGDFNAQFPFTDLTVGLNQVVVTVTDSGGDITRESVMLNYPGRNVWPIIYSIDWSSVTDIQDAVQVVDGEWSVLPGGVTTAGDTGYDRLLVIGDTTWTDFAATVPLTIHGWDSSTNQCCDLGLIIRWQGHTDAPVVCSQPKCGWQPAGNEAWYKLDPVAGHFFSSNISGNSESLKESVGPKLLPNVTYMMKIEVETIGTDNWYRKKVWVQGQAEPAGWLIEIIRNSNSLSAGSLLLAAHHTDVTFGDIVITPAGGIPNDPPNAVADAYSVDEDAVLSVLIPGVLGNDTDAEGDALAAELVSDPANGTVMLDPDGSFIYTPNTDYSGIDSFMYRATDAKGMSAPAAVTITVNAVPDAPVADDQAVTTEQDVPLPVTLTGSDADGDSLIFVISSLPSNGVVTGTAPNVIYTPDAGFVGLDAFGYVANDGTGTGNSVEATVSIDVKDLDTGLIGYWSFDAGTAIDDSGNGNNGVIVGAIPEPGHDGAGGLLFDGSANYVDLGTLNVTDGGAPVQAVSLAMWIRPDLLQNCSAWDCRIFSKATGTGTQDHFLMLSTIKDGSTGRLRFRLKTDGNTDTLIAGTGALQNGAWAHVAAVYDGVQMQLYLDGALVGSRPKSGTVDVDGLVETWIGGNPPGATDKPWLGAIDEVKLYSRALSNAEVHALAGTVPQVDADPPERANGGPRAILATGTTETILWLDTDEIATCRYGMVAGTDFASLPNTFSATGDTLHTTLVTGLVDGQVYDFYVRCEDSVQNTNVDDYLISFPVSASVDSPAPVATLAGSHPFAITQSTDRGKQISTLFPWEGNLYMGYGDWQANTGPIHIVHYDPVSGLFVDEFTLGTESVQNYRSIDGNLYVTSIDPERSTDPDYATRTPGGAWTTVRGPRLLHTFDINTLTGTDIWLAGSTDPNGEVHRSIDGGATWSEEVVLLPEFSFSRSYFVGVLNGKLYVEAWGGVLTSSRVFDGTSWSDGPDLLDFGEPGWRPVEFAGNMFYRTNQHPELINHLRRFDGTSSKMVVGSIRDFFVDGTRLYVLLIDGTIHYTEDGSTYSTFSAAVDSTYRSIGVLDGSVYVGTSTGQLYRFD